jgi:hypothetical protein
VKNLKLEIKDDKQGYIDKEVFITISEPKPLCVAIAKAFNSPKLEAIKQLSHYERTFLKWMQYKDGKLKERG